MLLLKRKSVGDSIFDICNYSLLTLLSISILIPLWNMVILSFADISSYNQLGFNFWLKKWNPDNYLYVFSNDTILRGAFNTVVRTVAGTIGFLFVTSLAAYALSKKNLVFRNFITILMLITMYFGGGLIPYYLVIKKLSLIDNFLVYIIPCLFASYSCIIIRNFMMQIGNEMEESAFIDGAGYATVYFKIVLPLSKPVLATVAVWVAIGQWNSWFDAFLYTKSENLTVLQLILRQLTIPDFSEAGKMMEQVGLKKYSVVPDTVKGAVTMITIVPIMLVYPFLQKYFVQGIMIGSLKG